MKSIQLHPVSVITGLVLALGVFGLSSVAQQASGQIALRLKGPVQVQGVPTPKQMMRIVEGSSFTVPTNKTLVVTGVLTDIDVGDVSIEVSFNGTRVANAATALSIGRVVAIPPGLVAAAGTSVSVDTLTGANKGVLLGYLADA